MFRIGQEIVRAESVQAVPDKNDGVEIMGSPSRASSLVLPHWWVEKRLAMHFRCQRRDCTWDASVAMSSSLMTVTSQVFIVESIKNAAS